MQAVNGSIETDFPLEVRGGKYGGPKKMEGRLGHADAKFQINTVNGSIKVYRADFHDLASSKLQTEPRVSARPLCSTGVARLLHHYGPFRLPVGLDASSHTAA